MNKYFRTAVLMAGIALLIFSIAYAFRQYVYSKEQNINVVTAKRLCYDGIRGAEREDCVKKSEAQYISFKVGDAVGTVIIFAAFVVGVAWWQTRKEKSIS